MTTGGVTGRDIQERKFYNLVIEYRKWGNVRKVSVKITPKLNGFQQRSRKTDTRGLYFQVNLELKKVYLSASSRELCVCLHNGTQQSLCGERSVGVNCLLCRCTPFLQDKENCRVRREQDHL